MMDRQGLAALQRRHDRPNVIGAMLTLMLLRHAKAVQHGRGDDFSRDLTPRGEADALKLGVRMAEMGLRPQFAFVSAARRTQRTSELFGAGWGAAIPTKYDPALYNASANELRDVLKVVDPDIRTLMIVGHNPGIMDLAVLLARDGDPLELARLRDRFSPGALAILSFETEDWRDARAGGGRLDMLLYPQDTAPQA